MVKLSSGETGVVVKNNPERRLKPEVMIVKDSAGNELETPETIDLGAQTSLSIAKDLPAESGRDASLRNIFEQSVLALASNDEDKSTGFFKRMFGKPA